MADERNIKSLSVRVDRDFFKQGSRLRRGRFRVALWTAAAAAVLVGGAWAVSGKRVFQSRPVATAHQFINNQCGKCHTESWEPLERLVTTSPHHVSTPDSACRQCHEGEPHHAKVENREMDRCASCHTEHRGNEQLARVADSRCTNCHGDLQTAAKIEPHFTRQVSSFASHPQFAALRRGSDQEAVGSRHLVGRLTEKWSGDAKLRSGQDDPYLKLPGHGAPARQDKTALRFNHQFHLNPKGIKTNRPGVVEKLAGKCETCHEPDAERRYMQPIEYVNHCQRCHNAQLMPEMDEPESLPGFRNEPVPHERPQVVRGVMRDRYEQFLRAMRAAPDGEDKLADLLRRVAEPGDARPAPGKPPKEPKASQRQELELVQQQLDMLERTLFTQAQKCGLCHVLQQTDAKDPRSLTIVMPPNIPMRWLPHSTFRHDSHRMLTCSECHQGVDLSAKTEHVLLPSIDTCRQCHSTAAGGANSARADCVECHTYHHREGETLDGRLNLSLELRAGPASSTSRSQAKP